ILSGCSDLSAGYCAECQACGAGAYREACIPGTDAPGYCVACPNAGLPDGQRFYKPAAPTSEGGDDASATLGGSWQDLCSPCSVCGGRNHNGSAYEEARCTATEDAVCRACDPCAGGGVLATAGVPMNALFSNQTVSVTLVKHSIELLGDFAGIGLDIAAGTRITTREPAKRIIVEPSERIIVSIITPNLAMLDAIFPDALDPVRPHT
ncbi:hypothetical protein T484DRAFT_1848115, partial [Baffinella frigidus]